MPLRDKCLRQPSEGCLSHALYVRRLIFHKTHFPFSLDSLKIKNNIKIHRTDGHQPPLDSNDPHRVHDTHRPVLLLSHALYVLLKMYFTFFGACTEQG